MSASQEIPEDLPQHASYWYRRWLVAQEGLDEEAAQRITDRGNRDLMHADLGDLLEACGMGNFARPQSSHEVMQEAVAKVRTLGAETTVAERERILNLLRRAADGRREYAGPDDGSEARPLLLASAEGYEAAAQLIEDPKRLLDVIPAWRWTAEEHASIRMEAP
jgi:hypothetical protein